MKKHISILFALLCFIAANLSAQSYEATYHLISKSYTLNEDGSLDYRYRKELQIFTRASFDTYGETFILYNPEFQTLTINEAYTVRKDGSVVKTPDNAFNPSLPYSCTDCERFNGMREMVVTHTALEYDATIVLDYTIHTEQPFIPALMERVDLCEDAPVDRYEVSVTLPHESALFHNVHYRGKNKSEVYSYGPDSARVLTWTFTDLPQKTAESYLLPDEQDFVMFTTFDSPTTLMSYLTMQNAFLPAPSNLYDEVLNPIMKKEISPMEKVLAIRDYVCDNIHTNALPMRYMANIIASPYMVWQSNCGTPVEKNLLLESMLRAAGYDARFGFMYNHLMENPEALLRLTMDGNTYYISALSKSPQSLDVKYVYDSYIDKNGEVINFLPWPRKVDLEAQVRLSKSDAGWDADVTMTRVDAVSPVLRTVEPSNVQPVRAKVTPLSGRYCQLTLDGSGYGTPVRSVNLTRERTCPVAVDSTEERYMYEVTLPAGAQWLTKPFAYEKEYPFGKIVLKTEIVDNKLKVFRQLRISATEIPLKQYKKFREMMVEWDAPRRFVIQY